MFHCERTHIRAPIKIIYYAFLLFILCLSLLFIIHFIIVKQIINSNACCRCCRASHSSTKCQVLFFSRCVFIWLSVIIAHFAWAIWVNIGSFYPVSLWSCRYLCLSLYTHRDILIRQFFGSPFNKFYATHTTAAAANLTVWHVAVQRLISTFACFNGTQQLLFCFYCIPLSSALISIT